jgi:predicted acetyltransferase
VHDVAEFFVLRKYRRQAVGRRAACLLFQRFPGEWEVRQLLGNESATRFWVSVIEEVTRGRFTNRRVVRPEPLQVQAFTYPPSG